MIQTRYKKKELVMLSVFLLLILPFTSCHEDENVVDETDAHAVLVAALSSFYSDDVEGYLRYSDFDTQLDSVQVYFISKALHQRCSLIKRDKNGVLSIEPTSDSEQNDSVMNVYYNITYGDNTTESFIQKMKKQGEVWKLRLRH